MSDALYPERLVVRVDPAERADPAVGSASAGAPPDQPTAPAGAAPDQPGASAGAPVDLVGTQAGPAGSSAIELPDGTVWEVDHADPSQLVQISTVGALDSPTTVESVAALIGEGRLGRAVALAERDGTAARVLGRENAADRSTRYSGRRPARRGDDTAIQVGRLIVLADLMGDPDLEPLARLAAGIELLLELEDRPVGVDAGVDLVRSQATAAEQRIAHLVGEIGDDELYELGSQDSDQLTRIRRAAQSLAGRSPSLQLPLERLLVRIGGIAEQLDEFATDATSAVYSESGGGRFAAAPVGLRVSEEPPVVEDFRRVERIEPALLRVTVARDVPGRWVRVLRTDGLVLLATTPLRADGLLQTAELAVPPDVTDDELLVEVVDGEVLSASARPVELLRAAIRAGRDAARSARLGDPTMIRLRWVECAALWDEAGDGDRAALARALADQDPWDRPTVPFLCDAVAELAVDLR